MPQPEAPKHGTSGPELLFQLVILKSFEFGLNCMAALRAKYFLNPPMQNKVSVHPSPQSCQSEGVCVCES